MRPARFGTPEPCQPCSLVVAALRKTLRSSDAKRPFGGPQQVLRYLANYTHRVALSNRRIVAVDDASARGSPSPIATTGTAHSART